MRKTLIALLFAAALPTVAMAMPPEDGGGHSGGMHSHSPYSQLNLTPDQRQQIGRIMFEQKRNRDEVTERYLQMLTPAQQKSMQDELAAKHIKAQSDVRALLKPDQQKQFDVIQQQEAQRRADHAEFQAWKAQKAQQAQ
ncbi:MULTISPECIES: Spy/CpxP family protein refolding chaperone [unclassified Pseudomonas]|uniref:Spy/CpxP family protein refolding chaperone n=1 Tax=unclassified Pseudomonas TaxID=196821 RepID=UPI002AC8ABCD|nr:MULTISPECIES: Spy/CpxP family protein refolding chaperone [unclassified Pseudomonas]MEB0041988.1 Spy/CpxP family protein refolding chaperone [Pseudomonas sp. MH10]MEB0079108.1 Spy/CpxP family protein refolding chaperone [Pseudomonas sp. MH10out]MEB0092085.1 Spy/CpxP family protein refolding chaperone [Pseudomonas sp. CCI4.2]MEB0100490.1 Spy/CpxP family protein refolding chaperone [Pseudomonas sp. CCI3.2]MEB0123637.1 Spy/CpxP family protein refolding chaperone [Pseudomonas sp. CCI1.2]